MSQRENACTVLTRDDWNGPTFLQGSVLPQEHKKTAPEKMGEWEFVSGRDRVSSTRPVQITLRQEGSVYFAECDRLHIYAHGESRDEAIATLHTQVVYFFKHYSRMTPDDVVGEAAQLRRLYADNFSLSH